MSLPTGIPNLSEKARKSEQFLLLPFRKRSVLAIREIPEFYVLDADALQPLHLVSGGFDHAADLAVLPLREDDGELARRYAEYRRRLGFVPVQYLHSGGHPREFGVGNRSVDFDDVFFFVFVFRMHEAIRKPPVVREDEESGGILVEAPDGKDALGNVENVQNARIVLGYAGSDDAAGFVDLVVYEAFRFADRFVAHLDHVGARNDRHAERRDLTVDLHETAQNELLRFPAGSDAVLGEVFLKADFAAFHGFVEFEMVHSLRLSKFGDNASLFRQFDAEVFAHGSLREIAKGGYVAPIRSGGSEKEIRMEGRYLRAADLRSFESGPVDERSGRMAFGVFKEGSASPARRLFGSAEFAERFDVHCLEGVSRLPSGEVEARGYDETVGRVLQDARTVGEAHVLGKEVLHSGFRDVPNFGGNEDVGRFESETSGIADHRAAETAGKADPGKKGVVAGLCHFESERMHFFSGTHGKPTCASDASFDIFAILEPSSGKRVSDEEPGEPIEREEAVRSVAEKGHGEFRGFGCGHGFRKDGQILL